MGPIWVWAQLKCGPIWVRGASHLDRALFGRLALVDDAEAPAQLTQLVEGQSAAHPACWRSRTCHIVGHAQAQAQGQPRAQGDDGHSHGSSEGR
eukprot:2556189-Prymnesium_polylepis.2